MGVQHSSPMPRALAVAFLCAAACSAAPGAPRAHPNGLVLTLPAELERALIVEQTEAGFAVEVPGERRIRRSATVALRDGAPPEGGRRAWSRPGVRYTVVEEDAGSGGTAYLFTGWRACGDRHLRYGSEELSELFEPDFDLAWALVDGARCP
jgi:hypothetical protein